MAPPKRSVEQTITATVRPGIEPLKARDWEFAAILGVAAAIATMVNPLVAIHAALLKEDISTAAPQKSNTSKAGEPQILNDASEKR